MEQAATGGRENGITHLTKDELFEAVKTREEDFQLPSGGIIRLRGVDVNDGLDAIRGAGGETGLADRMKRICLLGIIVPKLDAADLERLGEGSAGVVDKIAIRIMAISGLLDDEDVSGFLPKTQESKASSSTAPKSSAGSRRRSKRHS